MGCLPDFDQHRIGDTAVTVIEGACHTKGHVMYLVHPQSDPCKTPFALDETDPDANLLLADKSPSTKALFTGDVLFSGNEANVCLFVLFLFYFVFVLQSIQSMY